MSNDQMKTLSEFIKEGGIPGPGDVFAAEEVRVPSVPDMLRGLAKIYEDRNPVYGSNYMWQGHVLHALFQGDPVTIESREQWNRLHLIVHLLSKLSRYCAAFKQGGHRDSLDDLAVYAMMARECDELEAEHGGFPR